MATPAVSAALRALYSATGGAGWTANAGWMTGDPCTDAWSGITFFSGTCNLRTISLSDNNLVGTLPTDINALATVTSLQAHANPGLGGTLPTEIGALADLTVLRLNENSHTGPIPSELGMATMLFTLTLDRNGLQGSLPSQLGSACHNISKRTDRRPLTDTPLAARARARAYFVRPLTRATPPPPPFCGRSRVAGQIRGRSELLEWRAGARTSLDQRKRPLLPHRATA
jgi:hypothetical protein